MMETLPVAQDGGALALTGPALLEQWERLERAVAAEREKKAAEEAEARAVRVKELEELERRRALFDRGPGADARAALRLQLQDAAFQRWWVMECQCDRELQELRQEYERKAIALHARWRAEQSRIAQRDQAEAEALIARQKAEFNAGYGALVAKIEAARERVLRGENPVRR